MIATFSDPIGGPKWTHLDPHGPKFSIQDKKPVFGPKKCLTKMDDFIVFSVQKMIKVPSFMKFGAL